MNDLNINRLEQALSDILSRKYDAKITITYTPKDGKGEHAGKGLTEGR